MAALALMTAACSNSDNDILTPAEQPAKAQGITITAKLAPKSSAGTRAVAPGKDTDEKDIIVATWAVDEHLAILYEKDGNQIADATITAVDGSGVATITFTVVEGTADNTNCQIIYPYSAAKADKTGVKDNSTLLGAQNGTLNANLDVRVGAGTIQTSTPSLTVTTQPEAQFAIWKLTLDKTAKDLYITAGGEFLAGATLTSAGTEFTVAVPSVSSKTIAVVATDGSSNCWIYSKASVSLATGNYYQSNVAMTAVGTESSEAVYKITGTVSTQTIPDGKTVVLSGVTISGYEIVCSGNANIILLGDDNTVIAAKAGQAAIQIGGSGTTLTISGTGSLTAKGGNAAAGIGTNGANNSSSDVTGGNIVINGGTVTATGGQNAAGIGTGLAYKNTLSNTCGDITIGTGVTSVTATMGAKSTNSIGKGGGSNQTCGTITFGTAAVFNGSAWSPNPMVDGTYGGLTLAISTKTKTNDTWTLTPAP